VVASDRTDRRISVALVVLFVSSAAFAWAVSATGTWWWLSGMVGVGVGVVLIVTALQARDSGVTFAAELRRTLTARTRRPK
jgi:hypothetical protein